MTSNWELIYWRTLAKNTCDATLKKLATLMIDRNKIWMLKGNDFPTPLLDSLIESISELRYRQENLSHG